jgi:hypothetical protein
MKVGANQIVSYINHGNEEIATMARQYLDLLTAVGNVYYSGQWTADRPADEQKLWEELRDAAGLLHGLSPKPTPLFEQMQALKRTKPE